MLKSHAMNETTGNDLASSRKAKCSSSQLEFGQTHITAPGDTRYAPQLIAQRSALLLFTPETNTPLTATLYVRVKNQGSHSIPIALKPPSQPLEILEQGLTDVALPSYSSDAYHAVIPWNWIQEGYELEIAYAEQDVLYVFEHSFVDLSAPNEFTVTRAKLVLFGEDDFDTATRPSDKILRDFYGSVPAATMRWVDYLPWRLDQVVITTTQGPQLIQSEAELTTTPITTIIGRSLKSIRASVELVQYRESLNQNLAADGDDSPYSFGTSVGMGWFRRPDGEYQDLDDALGPPDGPDGLRCGPTNAAMHHSRSRTFIYAAHFTEGTGVSWVSQTNIRVMVRVWRLIQATIIIRKNFAPGTASIEMVQQSLRKALSLVNVTR